MEYTANADIKLAMQRAHAERGQVLKSFWARLFRRSKPSLVHAGVSRWA
ncbi:MULTISPECIES: hypothetical protein [Phycobacter]|nr:hypothetical protein [Phycobacter azelaicus]MBE1295356.1 hypothetical protein [Paracoccaceae bacterium]